MMERMNEEEYSFFLAYGVTEEELNDEEFMDELLSEINDPWTDFSLDWEEHA